MYSVATLPCNLSLMACFAEINVSQGSVATYARRGELLISIYLQMYQGIFQWKKIKSVEIWQNCGHESVAPLFWPLLYAGCVQSVHSGEWCKTTVRCSGECLSVSPFVRLLRFFVALMQLLSISSAPTRPAYVSAFLFEGRHTSERMTKRDRVR